jgi:hypothetical protein
LWRGWQRAGYLRLADLQTARDLQHIELVAGVCLRPRVYRVDLFVVRRRLHDEHRYLHHVTHRLHAIHRLRWQYTRYMREQYVHMYGGLHRRRM